MNLLNKISADYIAAFKNGDSLRKNLLSTIKASIKNAEIEKNYFGKKEELSDIEIIALLRKEIKKRDDSIKMFEQGERIDLVSIEAREIASLAQYLPAEVSDEKLNETVQDAIAAFAASSKKQMGQVIKAVSAQLGGAVDNRRISQKVAQYLK